MVPRMISPRFVRTPRVVIATAIGLSCFVVGIPAAIAGELLSVSPDFPSSVTVGQTGVPASLQITNVSTPPTSSVVLQAIQLTPSCGSATPAAFCPAAQADPGVLQASASGTGRAGSACAGQTFTIAIIDPITGQWGFTPVGQPVVLSDTGPFATCTIDFTFDVLRRPTKDADAGTAEIQTAQLGFAATQSAGTGTGTDLTTITQATTTLSTQASGPAGDGTISDAATLTAGAGAPSLTGTITFFLFGPNNTNCTGTTENTFTMLVNGDGTYSHALVPAATGTYRFIAAYSGDADNAPVSGMCNDANESVVVPPIGAGTSQLQFRGRGSLYTDANGHNVSLGTAAGGPVSFKLRVINTGSTPLQYIVSTLVNPLGATGAYANPAAVGLYKGSKALAPNPSGSTDYYTPLIAPGGSASYTLRVTPDATDPQGVTPVDVELSLTDHTLLSQGHTFTNVVAPSAGNTAWDEFVRNAPQPAVGGSFSGQMMTVPSLPRSSSTSESWTVKLQNDSSASAPIGLHLIDSTGCAVAFPATITMRAGTSTVDVTAAVLAGTYLTPTLSPGQAKTLTVSVHWVSGTPSCTAETYEAVTLDTGHDTHVMTLLQANLAA